uniref:Uncharacterized protein n=1 Tax=Glossina morsitans morsitans TaxID=37546 RepID=A0A1B0G7J9_GLOMM
MSDPIVFHAYDETYLIVLCRGHYHIPLALEHPIKLICQHLPLPGLLRVPQYYADRRVFFELKPLLQIAVPPHISAVILKYWRLTYEPFALKCTMKRSCLFRLNRANVPNRKHRSHK